jgi:hypothetical protein
LSAAAIVLAAVSSSLLGLALATTGPFYEPLTAAVLGASWVAVLVARPKTPVHGLLLFSALVGSGIVAVRGSVLLALAASTAALFAWDAVTMQRLFSTLPAAGRRRITRRYGLQALGTAAVALAAAAIGLLLRPKVGFPAALGLSLAVLALLGIALWQSGHVDRTAAEQPRESAVEQHEDDETQEEAGDP